MERVVEMKWKDRKREREIEARGQKRCSSSKANVTEKDGEWEKRPVFHLIASYLFLYLGLEHP